MKATTFRNESMFSVTVNIEPWGRDYTVPTGFCLDVHVEGSVGLIEYINHSDREISIFLNDCIFDDIATSIIEI